jgi:protocatechuate 3,4-dioxygenase beta subunit
MEELKHINNWQQAYLKYQNSGVATADENGVAILKVRAPQPYTVPYKGRLESHVHFRVCGENGMLSRVKTYFINSDKIDSF